MDDENQILIPESFMALFGVPGRSKSSEPRAVVQERYELCEDMAQLLTQTASTMQFSLGITEADVLQRVRQGLEGEDSAFRPAEADWVTRRLAELLNWDPS